MTPELILSAVQAATLLGALVFAVVQVRQTSQARRDAQAIELVRSTQSTGWAQSAIVVQRLPRDLSAEQVRALDATTQSAILSIAMACEANGYMVFKRVVPLDVINDLHGGIIRLAWDRLGRWVEQDRIDSGNAKSFEWFQWLAERLIEQTGAEPASGAHIDQREWRG